jgi:hypothetical protein
MPNGTSGGVGAGDRQRSPATRSDPIRSDPIHPYVWTHEGWLYLAAILDLCSRRVVGWATSANNDTPLALDALA